MPEIKAFSVGYLQTNCYVITDPSYGGAVVIDPGGGYQKIKSYLEEKGRKATAVLLTHGHFDHILALPNFVADGAEVYIHELDEKMLRNEWNLAAEIGLPPLKEVRADHILNGGETLRFGNMTFKVIHTPGHTQGGVSYDLDSEYIFTGDTLFYRTYGRTDFYGGSVTELKNSVVNVLFALDGDRIVYPGHNENTTLSEERKNNEILYL